MKKIFKLFLMLAIVSLVSCENVRVRVFGGNMDIHVKPGMKVTMGTWKDADLFYMIEPMEEDYVPKKKFFIEKSVLGQIESQITFIETR